MNTPTAPVPGETADSDAAQVLVPPASMLRAGEDAGPDEQAEDADDDEYEPL